MRDLVADHAQLEKRFGSNYAEHMILLCQNLIAITFLMSKETAINMIMQKLHHGGNKIMI